jgi:hypothetical protein
MQLRLFLQGYSAMSLGDWYSKFQDHYAVLEMSGTNHTVTWHHTPEEQRLQPCVAFLRGWNTWTSHVNGLNWMENCPTWSTVGYFLSSKSYWEIDIYVHITPFEHADIFILWQCTAFVLCHKYINTLHVYHPTQLYFHRSYFATCFGHTSWPFWGFCVGMGNFTFCSKITSVEI